MELPEAIWLKQFSWCVIGISAAETVLTAPGSLSVKIALSVLSCAMVVVGFFAGCLILYGYVAWLKKTRISIDWRHKQNLTDIAILLFYFGGIGSGIAVFIYPVLGGPGIPFSIAPMGIGLMLGAKWTSGKYFSLPDTAGKKVISINKQNQHTNEDR